MRTLLISGLLLALSALAQAQTVWRCGADGRTFSDAPCAQGRATVYAVARPAADVESAQARALREQELAERLTQDRLQREQATRGSGYAGFSPPTPAVKPKAKLAAKHKRQPRRHGQPPEADGTWRATAQASQRTKG